MITRPGNLVASGSPKTSIIFLRRFFQPSVLYNVCVIYTRKKEEEIFVYFLTLLNFELVVLFDGKTNYLLDLLLVLNFLRVFHTIYRVQVYSNAKTIFKGMRKTVYIIYMQ